MEIIRNFLAVLPDFTSKCKSGKLKQEFVRKT
jgi:hypothetical protein